MRSVLFLLIAAGGLRAEFLEMRVEIRDMNCVPCSENLAASLKRMRGVEDAAIDLKGGTVSLKLASGNRLGPAEIWDAIKRVGFTPAATEVRVRGSLKQGKLEVPPTGKIFEVDGQATNAENVELKGATAPPSDPRTPLRIKIEER